MNISWRGSTRLGKHLVIQSNNAAHNGRSRDDAERLYRQLPATDPDHAENVHAMDMLGAGAEIVSMTTSLGNCLVNEGKCILENWLPALQ